MPEFLNPNKPEELTLADLKILPELEQANIQRSEKEIAQLATQIEKEGTIRDPFIVWLNQETNERILVDGFTRRRIILGNPGLFPSGKVPCYLATFKSIEEAVAWINMNQNSRRNLTSEQRFLMIGNLYNNYKKNKEGLEAFLSLQGISLDVDDSVLENGCSGLLGDYFNVDEKTVRRYGHFASGIERLKTKNADLVNQYILGQLKDEKGKTVSINSGLIEKFGSNEKMRMPYKFSTAEDFKRIGGKEKETKEDVLKDQLKDDFKVFLKDPSQATEEKLIETIRSYRKEREDLVAAEAA